MPTSSKYEVRAEELFLLTASRLLVAKLTQSHLLSPTQRISVAKLQLALGRVPRVIEGLALELTVSGPTREFGEIETQHYWTITVEDESISVRGGGYFRQPSSGGDSFASFSWQLIPGQDSEYLDHLEDLWLV